MKKFLVVFMIFASFLGVSANAQLSMDAMREDLTLKGSQGALMPGGIVRTPTEIVVTAYITCGDLLTLEFTSSTPNATITIVDQETGEVSYTGTCNSSSMTVDLSNYNFVFGRDYMIYITTSSWEREGEFIFE